MILFILAAVFFTLLYIGYRKEWHPIIALLLGLSTIASSMGCVSSVGLYYTFTEDIANTYESVSLEYRNSSQTQEDWEWLVERCEAADEEFERIKDKHSFYMWVDLGFLIQHLAGITLPDYSIEITEDCIEFPEHMNLIPLRKQIAVA